jgi:beta-phosphoglucomutase-like phosphatase (HAD superfamily)
VNNDGKGGLGAVLWDLDGTVVDSEPSWFLAETTLIERAGGSWSTAQAIGLIGSDLNYTAEVMRQNGVPGTNEQIIDDLMDIVIANVVATEPWKDGIVQALTACHQAGLTNVLVTMSWRRYSEQIPRLLPGLWDVVLSGDDVKVGKPDPEIYLVACAKVGLPPARCVAVEDSPTGIASALAAGVPTVAIPNIAPVPPQPGLSRVASAHELTVDVLRRIQAGAVIDTVAN